MESTPSQALETSQKPGRPSFSPRTLRISKPIPKADKPKSGFTDLTDDAKSKMPIEELCLNEAPVDTTEIDKLLAEINDDSSEAKTKQILEIILMVNTSLDKNIKVIENAPDLAGDNVSRAEFLKLLKLFANYSRTLDNYFKEINQVKTI